jgi:RNA polymerase sigma-70 factor (ECF subfamily)
LPERQRRVIVLHHIADLPVLEIAAELGVPKGTVVSWLHRGRAQLAAHLGEDGSSSGEAAQS